MKRHELTAKVWPVGGGKAIEFEEPVNYVSLVNPATHGPPPVLAPKEQAMKENIQAEIAEYGDVTVLYINPASIIAAEVTRRA